MKKLKIIIPVLVIIIIAAVAAILVFAGDKFALTDESKVSMGLSKTMKTFAISDDIKDELSNYKYAKNMENNPYEAEIKMSVDGNIEELDAVGDEKLTDLIKEILEEISNVDVTLKLSMDSKDRKGTMEINVDAEDIVGNITGDVAFEKDQIAFRSKDLNEEYLVINKDDFKSEEIEQVFDLLDSLFDMKYSDFKFTKEELKYLKDTYGSILNDFITKDMMTSEKAEFEVNGKSKSCTKEILTIENDKFQELLRKYVETYENDKKGKEIIENKIKSIYGETFAEDYIEQVNDLIDSSKDVIDEIEDTKIEFITYCSFTEVYGTEIILTVDEQSASIKETFNDDETKVVITIVEEEIANLSIKNNKNEMIISGAITIEDNEANIDITISAKKLKFSTAIKQDGDELGTVELSYDFDTKKNTEKEFEQSGIFKIALDIPDVVTGDFSLNMDEKINIVKKIEYPDLDDAVEFSDQKALNTYVTKCQSGLVEYMKTLQGSNIYKIIGSYSGSASKSKIDTNLPTINNVPEVKKDSIDVDDIKDEISDWVELLDEDDDLTTSEIIEQNMITKSDFSEDVKLDIYTSWKPGKATDEGFLGLNVSDKEDNEYEFYIDLSDGTVYTEDDAPAEIEDIDWNEYK